MSPQPSQSKPVRRPVRPWAEMDESEIILFLNAMYGAWDQAGVSWGESFVVAAVGEDA